MCSINHTFLVLEYSYTKLSTIGNVFHLLEMSALLLHVLYSRTCSVQSDPEVSWSRHSEYTHQKTHIHTQEFSFLSKIMIINSITKFVMYFFFIYTDKTAVIVLRGCSCLQLQPSCTQTHNILKYFCNVFMCRQQNLRRKEAGRLTLTGDL